MERIFTEQEIREILEAEKILRTRGLIVDEVDGKESVDHNAERIASYFDLNMNIPVTVQTVLKACDLMKDQMHWKSGAQIAYEKLYNALTPSDQQKFGGWWFQQKNVLILENDEGYSNAAKIISWMKGRPFDSRALDLAVSNLAANRGLFLAHQSSFRPSAHTGGDGSFMPKDSANLTARDHARHAAEARAAASGQEPAPAPDYQALADAIKGPTHSRTEQIQKMFVTENGGISWEKTYFARRRMAGL